jgi:hypothetical protein
MINTREERARRALLMAPIYTGGPRKNIVSSVREAKAVNVELADIRDVYVSLRMSIRLKVTQKMAFKIIGLKAFKPGYRTNYRTKTQERAYVAARVAWASVLREAGIPPNPNRSAAKKGSSLRRSVTANPQIPIAPDRSVSSSNATNIFDAETMRPHPRRRGKDRNPRVRRAKFKPRLDPYRHPRAYSSYGRGIQWSVADQARAVDEGWFFERDEFTNKVRVLALLNGQYNGEADVLVHIQQQDFRNSQWHTRALAFIQQQFRHQYSDGWDRTVQRYTRTLFWYKKLRARRSQTASSSRGGTVIS